MVITKQLEREAIEFMNRYWDTYFAGNIETWGTFITDDYKNIGGTEEEIWNSKKEILDYTNAIIDQMVGTAELRNKKSEVFSLDPYILVHEFADIYIKINEDWSFYGKFRLSSILKHGEEGFQVVHQHGSYPDSKTEQGEAFAFDKISTENRELKDAVQRRTVELENKTRELEVEAALERVRTISMGMNKPDDMLLVCRVVSEQLTLLKIKDVRNVQTAIIFDSQGTYINYEYYRLHDKSLVTEIDFNLHPAQAELVKQMKSSPDQLFTKSFSGDGLKDWYSYQKTTNQFIDTYLETATSINWYFYSVGGVALGVSTYSPLIDEEIVLFKRFRNVFELAYRRYLDISKAEAQAREAQIEAAVEKVRAQSMAMYTTSDLYKVNEEILKQLHKLKVDGLTGVSIYLVDEHDIVKVWDLSSPGNISNPNSYSIKYDSKKFPVLGGWVELWKTAKQDYFVLDFPEESLLLAVEEFKEVFPEMAVLIKHAIDSGQLKHQWNPAGRLSDGLLAIDLLVPPTDDTESIVTKMAGAFNLAYQRFQDLQKAEAQAWEAQIEAALEKVRSRTMAMHSGSELGEVVKVIVERLTELGVALDANGVVLCTYFSNSKDVLHWIVSPDFSFTGSYLLPYFDHPIFNETWQSKENDEVYFSKAYSYEEKNSFFEYAFEHSDYRHFPDDFKKWIFQNDQHILSFAWQKNSAILVPSHTGVLPTEDDVVILKRFAKVFEQAYTRFLDLQKAEAQAKEAQIEAALERVRSRTMAMQRSDELGAVASVLFEEMNRMVTNLWTCGFVLCEKDRTEDEWWLSMDTGFTRGFFLPNVGDIAHATLYEGWIKNESFRAVQLDGELLQAHYDWLMKIEVARKIFEEMDAAGLERPTWQKLHAAYFSKGYLVLITREPCGEEEIFKRFAQVFDLTYTRFLDLKNAEAQAELVRQNWLQIKEEKLKAEAALSELKATQTQLIHAEKMASLGELTAGIAHEIQNPLNFVNNFSEVSSELVDEMNEELEKGDLEEAKAIASDIKQNLEKIGHHGKRADAIVKGMLQHSRSSAGEKQPTDINKLADEFLRLAYYGVRAKDKTFNVTLKTDYDQSIGSINIVSQDIGRVLLNLINNAFYAVAERKRQMGDGYEPEVTISTKLIGSDNSLIRQSVNPSIRNANSLLISVGDNGNGIPQKIMDKIFQPFFTTKPTGEGTGLGLSLCYDIVKSNGGEIKVNTTAGEGAQFVISLPQI